MGKRNNYNKFFNSKNETKISDVEINVVKEQIVDNDMTDILEENAAVKARVNEGIRLNMRVKPEDNAEVITILESLVDLKVVKEKSTDKFYKVILIDGKEGYCMKDFITIL